MRPAFFGEVILPASRAVDVDFGDNFDEDVPPRNEIEIDVKSDIPKQTAIKYLIIANGFHPSNFVNIHLIPSQPKAELAFTLKVLPRVANQSEEDEETQQIPTAILDFYYVPTTNSLIGVTVSKYSPMAEVAHDVVNKIFEHLGPTSSSLRIFVVDFKPSAQYQTFDRASIEDRLATNGIVRAVMTSKEHAESKNKIIQLEMPNMLDGLAGAVLTHSELNGLRAMAVVLYGPDSDMSSNIAVFRTAFQRAELEKLFFSQENESVIQKKLDALLRSSAPLSSVFG
jgi:hypothetical protein